MTNTVIITASQREAVYNIGKLASTGRTGLNANRRTRAAFAQIACINHQEVHDREIANAILDIHHCPGVNLERIERRALALLEAM